MEPNHTGFQTSNPFTGEILSSYLYVNDEELEQNLKNAEQAFLNWSQKSLNERLELLEQARHSIANQLESIAALMTAEMGKNIKEARAEVTKSLTVFDFVKRESARLYRSDFVHLNSAKYEVVPEALGPMLIIMPWNFPLWQVVRVMVPALAAGNVVMLKHAEICQGSAQKLASLIRTILPNGVFQNLVVSHEQCAKILSDRRVQAVSMTGSTRGGKEIATVAASHMKKMVFELGGSDPYLVCEDADFKKAAELCAKGRLTNSGQSCISAKRVLVRREVFDSFMSEYQSHILKAKFGDPLDVGMDYGPLAHARFVDQVKKQIEHIKVRGGEKIYESAQKEIVHSSGHRAPFVAPQAFLMKNMNGLEDLELFAPVTMVFRCESDEQMLEWANQSNYGLGGAVFTQNIQRARMLASRLSSGFVAINDYVRSDTHVPFGGVKDSGFGRELGEAGLREFINLKTIAGPV